MPPSACASGFNSSFGGSNSGPTETGREGTHHQSRLLPRTQADSIAEDVVVVALDGIEDALVGSSHDQEDRSSGGRQQSSQRPSGSVVFAGALDLEVHES